MDDNEYTYLMGEGSSLDPAIFQDVGESCYEQGWTDVFGFVTPKGEKDMENYRGCI